jgi:glucose-1-phosphate cytidylyltransferase
MKVVILAGGLGTRISEETSTRPKPMVEVGGRPILWHLMNIYSAAGFNEFIIACGYRQEVIKDYFRSLYATSNDLTVDFATGETKVHVCAPNRWRVHLIDTGVSTMTGGRVARVRHLIGNEPFLCTYGDGLASISVSDLVAFHQSKGRAATVTAVRPPARFGLLEIDGDRVDAFLEKPQASEGWINGGFFVFQPEVFELIKNDDTVLEQEPLSELASSGRLSVYKHEGFWQPMDTLRDRRYLQDLWDAGAAPWVNDNV